jgi:DNA-binding response OmpR family regulator
MPTILIVEDSPTVAAGLRLILEPTGFEVAVAEDGLSAFSMLNKIRPELILMDIGLPGIQGLDLCAAIRQFPHFASIPIIIVTGSHKHIDFAMARHMGANGYLVKPVEADKLLALVNQNIGAAA